MSEEKDSAAKLDQEELSRLMIEAAALIFGDDWRLIAEETEKEIRRVADQLTFLPDLKATVYWDERGIINFIKNQKDNLRVTIRKQTGLTENEADVVTDGIYASIEDMIAAALEKTPYKKVYKDDSWTMFFKEE